MSAAANPNLALGMAVLDMVPAQVLAAAFIKGCGKLTSERPELAHRVLANAWADISSALKGNVLKKSMGRFAASALFLESYFAHRGDWKAMEAEMVAHSPMNAELTAMLIDIINMGLDQAVERAK